MEKNIINEKNRRKLGRELTGIIQHDRIWEQWYDQDIFKLKIPKMSQKDYLLECIKNDPERIMINNRNLKKFTVNDFQKMITEYEKAFIAMNLQKGDVICTVGLSTPEMYAIKYSATSLGLITCNLNVFDMGINDDGKNRLYRQLENVNPKMIFTLDLFEDKVYSVINDEKFSKAVKVTMPLEYSTPIWNPERIAIGLKTLKDFLSGNSIKGKINLNDFLALGKDITEDKVKEKEIYAEKLGCNISFTSGTTGINKAVLLSHDANNALAFQHKVGDFGFKRKSKNLALVPPFLAFWDADIVHTVLCLEGENIIELALDYDKIPKYFKKYDANIGIWSQYLWSSILKLPEKDLKKVCTHLEKAIVGGERCEINAAETFYNKTGILQMTGFGASEVNTAFTLTHPDCIKVGTSGIPLPYNNVKIVDDSFHDVTYNVPGKLLITGPCLMNGYYNRPDLTSKAIYKENGIDWYITGDYAVLDYDGCLTTLDRYMEPVTINNNNTPEKVNPLDIVEIIKKNRNVKNCKMTFHGQSFILHLSIDDFTGLSEEEALENILTTIKTQLPDKHWPSIIKIYEELPRTMTGKVDYPLLNRIGQDLYTSNNPCEKLTIIYDQNLTLKRRK